MKQISGLHLLIDGYVRDGNTLNPDTLCNLFDRLVEALKMKYLQPPTAIRVALAEGDIDRANAMLGRRFEIRGPVIEGDKRGRTIGFPTANVPVPTNMAWPAESVYAGWYLRPDGARYRAAINIGRRPTFHDNAERSLLEAHLIDFDGDLYGEEARVQFVTRLRGEQKFDGIDALRTQLVDDIAAARRVLAT